MTEESRSRTKGPLNLIAGIVRQELATAFAALLLVAVACWIVPKGHVDFPCFDMQQGGCLTSYVSYVEPGDATADLSKTRMFLCISTYPRGWYGGGTLAQGPASSDTWSQGGIDLTRQDEVLIVNGQALAEGESFSRLRIFPSLNPWLLNSTHTEITNRGVFDCFLDEEFNEQTIDALYVYGSVSEGWLPNPLGLIILGAGIWLLVRGVRERRRK